MFFSVIKMAEAMDGTSQDKRECFKYECGECIFNCLYGRKVVVMPVSLKCEVCELKSRSIVLELEIRDIKKEMKTM